MARRKKILSREDHDLWKKVALTIEPLETGFQHFVNLQTSTSSKLDHAKVSSKTSRKKQQPVASKPAYSRSIISSPAVHHQTFDPKTVKKISRGKIAIDARIDLHGMTQEQAITALRRFIFMAHASDHRLVLVITGKGTSGSGILRRRVPDWLAAGELSTMVGGVREASRSHGGAGALYVRIRRATK